MYNFLKSKKLVSIILIYTFLCIIFFPNTYVFATIANGKNTQKVSKSKKSKVKNLTNTIKEVPNISKNNTIKSSNASWTSKKQKYKYRSGEMIVKFKESSNPKAAKVDAEAKKVLTKMLSNETSISSVKNLGFTNTKLVKFKNNKKPDELTKVLKTKYKSSIEYAEPNYILYASDIKSSWVPSDSYYNNLWGLSNKGQAIVGQSGLAGIDINAQKAWDITKGSNSVVVAVIDSGVDYDHPDLKNNIWINNKEIPDNYIDDDSNGYIDDVNGWDFYWNNNDPDDYNGHGTHVSGTIAAASNSSGVVGVAPNVKIMPLRFINSSGEGTVSDAIKAIDYATKMGAKILNNSWGGASYSQALYDAIKNSNTLFVAAAGNDGLNTDNSPTYPASYDLSNILSVAAIDNKGNLASFSNYGVNTVDVAAPGVNIYSTTPYNSYQYYSGTSMATPHVSGEAALVFSKNPSTNPLTIKNIIMKSVVKLSSLQNKINTGGLINAAAAVGGVSDDDIPGLYINNNSTVNGALNMYNDMDDVYNLELSKGDVVTISLSGAAGTDFDLYLYTKNATTVKSNAGILAYSENINTSTEKITYYIQQTGTYFIDVYSFNGTGNYTLKAQNGLTTGTYEDNCSSIPYNGTWNKISNTNSSGGTYTTANSSGSNISTKFIGTGIQLSALKNNLQGIAKITIDGTSSYIDLYSSSPSYKASVFTKTGLTKGTHTLKIEWTGMPSKKVRKAKGGTIINIDKLTVY